MVDFVTNRNCVYQTAYHVIWCPRDRRDVLYRWFVGLNSKQAAMAFEIASQTRQGGSRLQNQRWKDVR